MNRFLHRKVQRRLIGVSAAVFLFGLTSCLILPVDYHAAGSRRNITPQTTNIFQIGVTTREEVLLTLGEPDFVSQDGQRFGYTWSKVKVLCIVFAMQAGNVTEFPRTYLVETSFDPSNRVSAINFLEEWGDTVTR